MKRIFKKITIPLSVSWLLFFAFLPFLLVLGLSFLTQGEHSLVSWPITCSNYWDLFHSVYVIVFLRSLYLAAASTILSFFLAYPFAYMVAKTPKSVQSIAMFLLILPFWTSSLIRTYALIILIRTQGLLNHFLIYMGFIHEPFHLLYTKTAVLIGLVYTLLPFMILPIFTNFEKMDWRLLEAAQDLGANRWQILKHVILPLTKPGIVSGVLLVFLPAMTMFYIPDILGGAKSMLLGNLIKNQFIESQNWPMGAATSILLTLLMAILIFIYFISTTEKQRVDLMA